MNSRTIKDLWNEIQGLSSTCPVFKYFQGLEIRSKKFKYFQGCVGTMLIIIITAGDCVLALSANCVNACDVTRTVTNKNIFDIVNSRVDFLSADYLLQN